MNIDDFKNNIPSLVEQAKDTVGHISNKQVGVDIESMSDLDETVMYMNNLFKKGLISEDVAWNASVSLGVLLGEMILSKHKFYWDMNENGIPVLKTNENSSMSPITKVYKVITDKDGVEGTPSGLYNGYLALEQYYAMSDEEREAITEHISSEKKQNKD